LTASLPGPERLGRSPCGTYTYLLL
jgi:hypothetical protein